MAVKEDIAEKALELFLDRGYDNTPMSHVAKALGASKAGLYHYFPNKEDLLYFIIHHLMEKNLIPILEKAEEISDPEQRLKYFLRSYTELLSRDSNTRLVIHEAKRLSSSHYETIKSTWSRVYKVVCSAISEMAGSGTAKKLNKAFAAFAAIGMCSWTFYWFDYDRRESAEELADAYLEIFLNGIKER